MREGWHDYWAYSIGYDGTAVVMGHWLLITHCLLSGRLDAGVLI